MRKGRIWLLVGFSLAVAGTTLLDHSPSQASAVNAALVGFALLLFAAFEECALYSWMDAVQIALGAWLAISVFVLPASGGAFWAHLILGSLLALTGMLSLLAKGTSRTRNDH